MIPNPDVAVIPDGDHEFAVGMKLRAAARIGKRKVKSSSVSQTDICAFSSPASQPLATMNRSSCVNREWLV